MDTAKTWGVVAVAVFVAYLAFQIALAAGVPWGRLAWGGQTSTLSTGLRIASGVAAVVYGALAVLVARQVGVIGSPPASSWPRIVLYVVAGLMVLGVFANLASPSAPERFHAIGAALLAGSCFFVAHTPVS